METEPKPLSTLIPFSPPPPPHTHTPLGPLTLKLDRTTRHFLKFDRRHWAIQINMTFSKNSDRGHCHFLKSTGAVGLIQNRQVHLDNSNGWQCDFLCIKSTGDIGLLNTKIALLDYLSINRSNCSTGDIAPPPPPPHTHTKSTCGIRLFQNGRYIKKIATGYISISWNWQATLSPPPPPSRAPLLPHTLVPSSSRRRAGLWIADAQKYGVKYPACQSGQNNWLNNGRVQMTFWATVRKCNLMYEQGWIGDDWQFHWLSANSIPPPPPMHLSYTPRLKPPRIARPPRPKHRKSGLSLPLWRGRRVRVAPFSPLHPGHWLQGGAPGVVDRGRT